MTNKVQIGIDANVSGVEAGLNKVESGAADVSKSFGDIGKATDKAAAGFSKLEYSAKRLQGIAQILKKEFGKTFDPKQAEAFIRSFDSIRSNRHISGSSKLRAFDSFEAWHAGNSSMFVNPADADRYRRRVFGLAGSGLGVTTPAGGHGSHGGAGTPQTPGERGNSPYGGIASRGMSGGMKLAGAGLALAGVGSLMAMAGRAVDLAKQESTSTDQLLRKSGDLTQSFDSLREKVRLSGDGLGVLYTEAAQLGKQYVEQANGDGGDIRANLRTGFGLSRAYGLELGEGVGFMAQARHYGQIKSGDKDGKQFALLIAEAIEKGQTTGKAGEVLQAVSSFSAQVARLALSPANIHGFGGALAGLTASGDVGFKGDPSNAASMLMTVDSAIRRGGNMGEASLNFQYGALSRHMPGLDPIMAKAIMEQGAFGSGVADSIKTYASRGGMQLPDFSKADNLSIMMGEMDRQYGNSSLKLDAIKNHFGLSSYGHAAALANLDRKELDGLSGSGIDISALKASGIGNVARIAGAGDDELKSMAARLGKREDLTDDERSKMSKALEAGDMKALREAMIKTVSIREQEKNVGTETRDAVVSLNNELTKIGAGVLPAISAIQSGVAAMAGALAPDSAYSKRVKVEEGLAEYKARKESMIAEHKEILKNIPADAPKNWRMMEEERQAAELQAYERSGSDFEDYMANEKKNTSGNVPDASVPIDLGPKPDAGSSARGGGGGGKQAFLKQYEEVFKSAGEELGVSPKVLAAQFALETNWGKSVIPGTNNLGNIKATGWSGRSAVARDNMLGTNDRYRAYDSPQDFAADHARLIKRNYPDALNTGDDPVAFARALQNGRGGRQYAEDPNYASKIKKIHSNLPADSFSGGVPEGNPAGNPAAPQRLDISLEGMMRDSEHRHVADIAPIQHTISFPMAAGVA